MRPDETQDFKRLCADPAFHAFLYRLIRSAGVFSPSPTDGRDFAEGRRALALEVLAEVEAVQAQKTDDGLPVFGSIQILTVAAQTAAKEKPLGRRSDPYRDINTGDGDDGSSEPE